MIDFLNECVFLSCLAEFMSKGDSEAGNDASLSEDSIAGVVRGSSCRHGETPELPRLWFLLQGCE